MANRIIGITHRVKKIIRSGEVIEERPTQVMILEGSIQTSYQLRTDQEELDFVLGIHPVKYRKIAAGEDISLFPRHQVKWREYPDEGMPAVDFPEYLVRDELARVYRYPEQVPAVYDGFASGDTVAMVLGGSGDRLACAFSNRGETIGAYVYRVAPHVLKTEREKRKAAGQQPTVTHETDHDHVILAGMARDDLAQFSHCDACERNLIRLREAYRARQEAQVARISCEHRLRQQFIGLIFCSESGQYPAGKIEDEYDVLKASDVVYRALCSEEKRRTAELQRLMRSLAVWTEVLGPVTGCGEVIAAGIVSSIGDIRRFATDAKLKAFSGVHVFGADGKKMSPGTVPESVGGRFVRRRSGVVSDWNPVLRQSLYLLGDQFVRQAKSPWGLKLREYKAKFRAQYPEPIVGENGRKRYTDGHIHKMAYWRTLTKFVEWLHFEWTRAEEKRLEKRAAV